MPSRIRRDGARADVAAIAALIALWLRPVLAVRRAGLVLSAMDSFCQHLPDYLTSARLWSNGLPLWNPLLQCGMPQLGYAESAALYPGLVLFRWLSPTAAFNALLATHWLALALGMYAWSRSLRVSPLGSFCAAALALLCPVTIEHMPYSGFLAFAWMPWLGLALTLLARTRRRRYAALAAAAIALPFYGGHPQYWVSWLALCAAYSATLVWQAREDRRGAALLFAAAWAAGLSWSMPQALPALAFLKQGPRALFRRDIGPAWVLGAHQAPASFATSLLLDFNDPGNAVLGPEGHAFVGLLAFLLAGLAAARRRPGARFFAAAAAGGAALALSAYTGAARLVYHIPFLSLFHDARRETLLLVYPVALLAGMGLDAAAESAGRRELGARGLAALCGAAAAIGAAAAAVSAFGEAIVPPAWDLRRPGLPWTGLDPALRLWLLMSPEVRLTAFFCVLVVLLSTLAVWRISREALPGSFARWALAAALLMGFWPQLRSPLAWMPTSETPFLAAPRPAAARLILEREGARVPPDRVASLSREPFLDVAARLFSPGERGAAHWETLGLEMLLPNVSQLYGVHQVGLWHDAFTRLRAVEIGLENWEGHVITEALLAPECALLPMLGVRYVVVHKADAADPVVARFLSRRAFYAPLLASEHSALWERKDVLPRFRLMDDVRPAPSDKRLEGHLVSPHPPVDFRKTVYVDPDTALGVPLKADLAASSVQVVSYGDREIRLSVDARGGEAFLVEGDAYDPGWRARVDGAETRVVRANLLMRALRVPQGRHEVVLRYEPSAWTYGLWAAAAGAALLLAVLITAA